MWSVLCMNQSKKFKLCLVKRNYKKNSLQDQFQQTWLENIQNNSKTLNYRSFKDKLEFENYFDMLEDRDLFTFCHF